MLASAIVVFREVLEAALIIGIVLAATRGVIGRGWWVSGGIAAGVIGAIITALFADHLAEAMEGIGQELFNAGVLFAAVIMLSWHNVWMSRHARSLAQEMKTAGGAVAGGERPLYSLAIVVGLAVLREGAEIVLFLYGMVAGSGAWSAMLAGSSVGFALGAVVGAALYLGLLRIPMRHLFTVTSWMILLLAAGMAAQGAKYLVQADVAPALGTAIWNTSAFLSEEGLLGQTLHTLIGYSAQPSGIQVLAYVATLITIGLLMIIFAEKGEKKNGAAASVALGVILGLGALIALYPGQGNAGTKVYSPTIDAGEFELEARGYLDVDDNAPGTPQRQIYEVGYGFTDRWFSSVYIDLEDKAGQPLRDRAVAWENIFQFFEQGERWMDAGLYLEYKAATRKAGADKIEGKLLLEKETGRFVHTVNIILEKEIGDNSDDGTELGYAYHTVYRWKPEIEFALEAFGNFGEIRDFHGWSRQEHHMGPTILGRLPLTTKAHLKYELGYLIGLTDDSSNGRLKWLIELEMPL